MSLVGHFINVYVILHFLNRNNGDGLQIMDDIFQKWQDIENPVDPLVITITCTCVSAKCIKCPCSKQTMQCTTFCKCKRNCLFTHI